MAMGLNKQIQFVRQPKPTDGEIIAQVAVFDEEGNPVDDPVDVGGAPTADTLAGATNTGKAVLKATDAAGARKAIGAGTSSFSGSYNDLSNKPTIPPAYTLPAATAAALGGVKKGAAIPDLASDADAATIATKVNSILTQLRAIGVIAA